MTTKNKIILLDDNGVQNAIVTSKNDTSIVGNVYVGRVAKIVNNNFAFINIGEEKNAFLDLTDAKEKLLVNDKGKAVIKEGDKLTVQVLKDKTDEKGCAVTSQVNYNGDDLVLFECAEKEVRVSKKINKTVERDRLKEIVINKMDENCGVIFRTSAISKSEEEIIKQYDELYQEMQNVKSQSEYIKPPCVVRKVNNIIDRYIAEMYDDEVTQIITNDKKTYNDLVGYYKNIEIVFEDNIIIPTYVENALQKLTHNKIWLKGGGFICIDETEAGAMIDVNTGKMNNVKDKQKLIVKTNIEAVHEIARQIKIRNISGIIIVDFIDIKSNSDNEMLRRIAKEAFKKDKVPTTVVGITKLGLMEITRKKTRDSFRQTTTVACTLCNGTGRIADYDYITDRIFRELFNYVSNTQMKVVTISSNEKVINSITTYNLKMFEELGKKYGCDIRYEIIATGRFDYYTIG